MKIECFYGPDISIFRVVEDAGKFASFSVGYVMLSEKEALDTFKDYLAKRARHRRMAKFVDPGMT